MVSPTTWNPQFISSQWMHPSSSDMVKRIPCAPQNPGGALAMLPTLGVSSTWAKCQHCVWVSFRFIIIHLPHLSSPLSFLTSFQTHSYATQAIEPAGLEGFHISSSLPVSSVRGSGVKSKPRHDIEDAQQLAWISWDCCKIGVKNVTSL